MLSRKNCLAGAVGLILSCASATAAAQFTWGAYLGAGYSDNITLAPTDPVGQTEVTPGLSFNWDRQGANLQAHVLGDLGYRYYPDSDFKSQTMVSLTGQAFWTLSPQRFGIAIADRASVEPINTLASDAPGNRQQVNVFSVAPTMFFRLGSGMRGQLQLRYLNSRAEETRQFDSQRAQLGLRVLRDLSATSQLSLNASSEEVDLTHNELASDYTRHQAFIQYQSKLAHLDLDAALGATRINFDRAGVAAASGGLARLGLDWHVSARSTLGVHGRRQLGDAAESMMLDMTGGGSVAPGGLATGGAVTNSQVFVERTLELSYGFHGERLDFALVPRYRKLSYVNDASLDRTGRGGSASLDYRLSPNLVLGVTLSSEDLRYQTLARHDKTRLGTLGLRYQRDIHWIWQAMLSRHRRTSDFADAGFQESRIYFQVTYQR